MAQAESLKFDTQSPANTEGEMPIISFIKFILKKWVLVGIICLLSAICGVIYSSFKKPKYESRLTFSLDAGSSEGTLSSAMNFAAQLGIGFGSGQSMFDGDNIIEIMKSRRMIETTLLSYDTFDNKPYTLAQYFYEKSGLQSAYSKKKNLKNIQFPCGVKKAELSYLQDSVLYNIYLIISKENLSASRPDKKLGIYEVKVLSANERFSKIFTDRIVSFTSSYYTEITSKKELETLEILEQRVASIKEDVGTSIENRAGVQDANLNPAFAAAQSPLLKQQYNIQSYGEAYKEMFKTLEMARYQYLKKIPLLQIIDNADYPMKIIKIGKLMAAIYFSAIAFILTSIILIFLKNMRGKFEN